VAGNDRRKKRFFFFSALSIVSVQTLHSRLLGLALLCFSDWTSFQINVLAVWILVVNCVALLLKDILDTFARLMIYFTLLGFRFNWLHLLLHWLYFWGHLWQDRDDLWLFWNWCNFFLLFNLWFLRLLLFDFLLDLRWRLYNLNSLLFWHLLGLILRNSLNFVSEANFCFFAWALLVILDEFEWQFSLDAFEFTDFELLFKE
jgi:hypothetical protein